MNPLRSAPLLVVLVAAAVGAVYWFLPGERPVPPPGTLPWQVVVTEDGHTRVLGLTLGESPLREARRVFGDEGELSLFRRGGAYALEAYFDEVRVHGLRAKVVLSLDASAEQLAAAYDRGTRISTLPSGDKRITLHPDDIAAAAARPVRAVTYLPKARLDADIVRGRFGTPAERLVGPDGVTHWLYPERGVDVGVDPDGRAVFQYVLPAAFPRLAAPLRQAAAGA